MINNLLSLTQQTLGSDFSKLASEFLGESPEATKSAVGSLMPLVLGGIAQRGTTLDGATSLLSLLNANSDLNPGLLDSVGRLFGSGGAGANSLVKLGTAALLPALFGDRTNVLANAVASATGLKNSSALPLLGLLTALALTILKRFVGQQKLNAGSLSSLLRGQAQHLTPSSLDGRLLSALGFASPAAYLARLGGDAVNTASAAASATKSGVARWLPWLLGAGLLLLLWNLFADRATPPATTAPAVESVPAVAPAPAVAPTTAPAAAFPASIYFATGSAAISPDDMATLRSAADAIRNEGGAVTLTGYTDRTGDAAANEELAKSRALAVRDALVTAGVAESSIELRPPLFVEEGSVAGDDAAARRVEIGRP